MTIPAAPIPPLEPRDRTMSHPKPVPQWETIVQQQQEHREQ